MNKEKRNDLLSAIKLLENAKNVVERVRDREQDCLDNMPENLEGSERYTNMETAIDLMDSAVDAIDEACDSIGEAMN